MAVNSELPAQTIPGDIKNLVSTDLGPATPSLDHTVMAPFWQQSTDLLEGWPAIKAASTTYLPKHPKEADTDYKYRLSCGILTNIYADTIESLSAKPFDQECHIVDGSASAVFIGEPVMVVDPKKPGTKIDSGKRKGGFQEDVDGKGSHLHVFAREVFKFGISNAIDWIFVDYPKVAPNLTLAEEKKLNIKPYWYRVAALNVLEVQDAMVGGKRELIYVRFREWKQVRVGWATELRERVREITRKRLSAENEPAVYGIPEWVVLEKDPNSKASREEDKWSRVDNGVYTIGEIPMVPFITGTRRGTTWQFNPPMKTAADLQIVLYNQETGLENINRLVNYPMLSASGVNLKNDDGTQVDIVMGPNTILVAPPPLDGAGTPGKWDFLSPDAAGLTFSQARVDKTKEELRELGRQPLTAQSQNITVVTSAFAASKANSAVQAWALALKDALENALRLTALWMKEAVEPEVFVFIDFPDGLDDESFTEIREMRASGDISRKTLWSEASRRSILGPDFDSKQEEQNLAEEIPTDDADEASDSGNPGDKKPEEDEEE